MSRHGFTSLDHEPKNLNDRKSTTFPNNFGIVPPPSYRSTVIMDTDTWSQYSTSSAGLTKRRNSWTNLVESDENLTKHKINCYPKVTTPFKHQSLSSANSVASDVQTTEIFRHYVPRNSLPVLADPSQLHVRPAGSLPPASRGPSKAPSIAMSPMPGSTIPPKVKPKPKRNRLQEMKKCCCRPLCCLCLLLVVVAVIVGIIIAVVLSIVLPPPEKLTLQWYPPAAVSGPQNQSSTIQMTTQKDQVKFQLQGGLPFKGNYISYYDFKSNKVVVIDESLKSNGRNLACFVLPLDKGNLPDENAMRKAAAASKNKNHMANGWQESWMWIPNPMTTPPVFNPPIKECDSARWIQLDQAQDQKSRKCSDCYDFCLPDYGIEKDGGNNILNILRRDCFYLFVPEWRSYAQANSIEQNQRDFETYYRNRVHLNPSFGGPNGDSKWISLSVPPGMQNVANQTGQALGAIGGTIQNLGQGVSNAVFGNNQQPGLYGNMVNTAQNVANTAQNVANQAYNAVQPFGQGVTGVVNLHGINGNNGNNLYQTGSMNGQNGMNAQSGSYGSSYGSPNTQNGNSQSAYGQTTNTQQGSSYGNIPPNTYAMGYPGVQTNEQSNTQVSSSPYGQNSQQSLQMNGVNGGNQQSSGYIASLQNVNSNSNQQNSAQSSPYSSSYGQQMNQNQPIGVINSQNTNYQPTFGSTGYSSDPVRIPSNRQLHANLQASLQGANPGYTPDVSNTYQNQVQGISGMELPRQQNGNSPYTPDVTNAQPTGRWVQNS